MVVAWRAWALDDYKVSTDTELPFAHAVAWHLMSIGNTSEHSVWEPKQSPPALCLLGLVGKREHHVAPHEGCRCGYYGYSTLEHCLLSLGLHDQQVGVVGQVKLSGRILREGETYRAEFAYPERLILIDWPWRNTAEKARELAGYGVPVEVRPHPERR